MKGRLSAVYAPARRWLGVFSACVAVVSVVVGCGLSPGPMASSVRQVGGGDEITVSFANTLNLPEGADVTLNGTKVGSVNDVHLRGDHVDAVTELKSGVRIPAGARASIRQDTVLGDPYVAIEAKSGHTGQEYLARGAVIPVTRTTSPPPLEDTLAVLSNFVNGGSIQDMQTVVRLINGALPVYRQTQRVAKISAVDLKSLAGGTDQIDGMLSALDKTAGAVIPRLNDITDMLSPEGMHYWSNISAAFKQLGVVIPSIGSVFEGGYWLVPMLTEVNGSIYTVRDGIDAIGSNQQLIRNFLSDKLFPFIKKPRMNVVSATSPDGQEVLGNVEKVLRMLGAIR